MNDDRRAMTAALSDLARWSESLPDYDLAAGKARHAELLERGATGPDLGVTRTMARRGWWVGGAAAVVLGVAAAVVGARAPAEPSAIQMRPSEDVRASAEPPPVPVPVPEVRAASEAIAVAAHADPPPPAVSRPMRPRKARVRADATQPVTTDVGNGAGDAVERELAVVRRLRGLVERDPRAALALAREAELEFVDGIFAEERAALRVFALAAARDPGFAAAADAFLRSHGRGPFAARVRALQAE